MPALILKGKILHALLWFKDLNNLNNAINPVKLELLKLNFTNIKYLIEDKVSTIIAKLLVVLDTYLCLITNFNERFRVLSIILSNSFT